MIGYGRSRLIDSTGDRTGRVAYTLHEDGSVWKFQFSDSLTGWSKASNTLLGATSIDLSSDVSKLLVQYDEQTRLLNAASGEFAELGKVVAAAWAPQSAARLAVCRQDGSLEIMEGVD